MTLNCKKCPYFGKTKEEVKKGSVVLGFCRLRQKHVTDVSISSTFCKDRAVLDI